MRLLLHTCCAPCAIYPVEEARRSGYDVTSFFYNPNIHPYAEYGRRKDEVEEYCGEEKLELVAPKYDALEFFDNIRDRSQKPDRCSLCWDMRLETAAAFARSKGFDSFTTTLLGSPYQDTDLISGICERLSKAKRLKFYRGDFRAGFREAHKRARSKGMYCQNYCGCVFSMIEREERKRP